MGTPLSTIALAAKEMRADVPEGPLAEDVDLIISQTARCRAILAKLRNLGADEGDPFAAVPLGELLAEVARPHRGLGKEIVIVTEAAAGPEPVFRRNVGLLQGLGNLVENAANFARASVVINALWDKGAVTLVITDDGPGFPPDLIARLGEPYLTTRATGGGDDSGAGGLGLGIFIAKTLLGRTGARLAFENVGADGGARVKVIWPRKVIETEKATAF